MAEPTLRLAGIVASLGRKVLARRAVSARTGGRGLAKAVIERRRPSYLEAATRLARGRSLARETVPAAAELELTRPPGLSDFAARWLFGDGLPEGTPFSDAVAQAALARTSDDAGLPPLLDEGNEEARVAAQPDAARRLPPAARGRVEEVSSFKLSRMPRSDRPSELVPPDSEAELEIETEPAVAPEPRPEPPEKPPMHRPGSATVPARLVVLPRPQAESSPAEPSSRVRLVARTPTATPPVASVAARAQVTPAPGFFRRLFHALVSAPETAADAPVESSGPPTFRRLLRLVRGGSEAPQAEPPLPKLAEAELTPIDAAREPDALERSEIPTRAAWPPVNTPVERLRLRGAVPRLSVSRTPVRTQTPTRPQVRLSDPAGALIHQSARPPAGTSAIRLAAASGAPLVSASNGTAVVFATPAPEAEFPPNPLVGAASAPLIARLPDTGGAPRPSIAVAAAEAPAQPLADLEHLDMDEIYEQVVERLRRDLLAERERMGDLLGDLRR